MGVLVAGGASDPLPSDLILRGGEPALRKHFYQSGLEIENEQRHRRIVIAERAIRRRSDQFIDLAQFGRNLDFVRAGLHGYGNFEVADGFGRRVNPVRRLAEPPGNLGKVEGLHAGGLKAGEAQVLSLRTPDADAASGERKRPAVDVEGEAWFFG